MGYCNNECSLRIRCGVEIEPVECLVDSPVDRGVVEGEASPEVLLREGEQIETSDNTEVITTPSKRKV